MMLWLYVALFLAFGAVWWLTILKVGWRPPVNGLIDRSPGLRGLLVLLGFMFWGGLGLELTLLIQPPIQNWYMQITHFDYSQVSAQSLIVGAGVMLITGIVQEFLKGVPLWIWFWVAGRRTGGFARTSATTWLQRAAAVGFGFGAWEAIRIVAVPISTYSSFSWLPVYERFWAIGFHVLSPVLMVALLLVGHGFLGYVVAAVFHGAINYSAILRVFWILDTTGTELLITAVVLVVFFVTWYRLRVLRGRLRT